jgi:hypothetical protein
MDYGSLPEEESSEISGGILGNTITPRVPGTMDTIISILVPILVVIVIIILLPNVNMHMPSAILLVYIQAAFELLSGVMFGVHISTKHNGWSPSEGMESYLDQCGGISDLFWGLLLLFEARDPTMLRLNGCYCAVWFVFLGSILFKKPSDAANVSCTKVPIAVKGICGAASFIAAADFRLYAK